MIISAKDLAINGGSKARTTSEPPMFPGGMEVGQAEEEAAARVIKSKRLIRFYGPYDPEGDKNSEVDEFEREFAERMGADYALGVTSCTASLMTALVALGIGPGDEVIIPAYTFVATPSAVLAVGAIPILADVDDSLTLDPHSAEENITEYTRAILPVHMRGMPAKMDEIVAIARGHSLAVIEDVAQAAGAAYRRRPLGSIGDVGCFSLQMHKIITTGEGGVLVTDDAETLFRAKCFHDSASEWRGAAWQDPDPTVRATFEAFPGMNFRMAEITGAIGRVQLRRLDGLLERMRVHKARIRQAIVDSGRVELRHVNDPDEAATCVIFFGESPEHAHVLADALQAEGLGARVLFSEGEHDWHVYACWRDILAKRTWNRQGYPFSLAHRPVDYSAAMCPKTLELLGRAIHLDVAPQLTERDVNETTDALTKVLAVLG